MNSTKEVTVTVPLEADPVSGFIPRLDPEKEAELVYNHQL